MINFIVSTRRDTPCRGETNGRATKSQLSTSKLGCIDKPLVQAITQIKDIILEQVSQH